MLSFALTLGYLNPALNNPTLVVGLAMGIVLPPTLLPSLQWFRPLPTFSFFFQFSLAQLYHNGIGMTQDLKVALSLYEVFQEEF